MNAPAGRLGAPPAPTSQPTPRHDGWTPKRQRTFLTALAEGHTVEVACSFVGLSVPSAYALRRRPAGAAFALGWRAACLLARDKLADVLMSRAIDGQVDTYTRADGAEVTRHRFDNRLAMAMLTRLDRLAERSDAAPPPAPTYEDADAARAAAADFAGVLALVEEAEAPDVHAVSDYADEETADDARAAATGGEDEEADDLPPIAEAVADFVAAAVASRNPKLPKLRPCRKGREWIERDGFEPGDVEDDFVWWDEDDEQWLTSVPPPDDFDGIEYGDDPESPTYARTIMDCEYPGIGLLNGNPPGADFVGPEGAWVEYEDEE